MAKRGTTETPEVKTAETAASGAVTEQTNTPTEGAENKTPEVKTAETAASGAVTEQTNTPTEGAENKTPEVKTAETAASERSDVSRYSKEKLLKSNWYSHRRDILNVILNGDKEYSHAEVDALIGDFLKGKVN
ncbi:hypothetical protein FACS1894217_11650 [Clostridia bacterium]|nr:hypothetical protein FACS1894217_11650 [Clostridia bacterium]